MRLDFRHGVIAVVAGIAFVVSKTDGESGRPRIGKPKAEIWAVRMMIDRFHEDCGRYPTTAENLEALTVAPPGLEESWKGPYSPHPVVRDLWGKFYEYRSDGRSFTLTSFGADGKPDGEGDDADLLVSD